MTLKSDLSNWDISKTINKFSDVWLTQEVDEYSDEPVVRVDYNNVQCSYMKAEICGDNDVYPFTIYFN